LDWDRFLRRRDFHGGCSQQVECQRNVTADTFTPALRGDCRTKTILLASEHASLTPEAISKILLIGLSKGPTLLPGLCPEKVAPSGVLKV